MKASFHGHDQVSADKTKEILKRLKQPGDLIALATEAVSLHMRLHELDNMKTNHKKRRLVGRNCIDVLETLVEADEMASLRSDGTRDITSRNKIAELRMRFPEMLPLPIVTGQDLQDAGLKPGISFGYVLHETFNKQLDGVSDKTALVKFALGINKQFMNESLELQEKHAKRAKRG